MLVVCSALALGFLHGLGADHLMAIATLSAADNTPDRKVRRTCRGRARALGVAVRFALGHALFLGGAAGALVALGWSVPRSFEPHGEALGGALLIVLGGVALWSVRPGRVYGHSHLHGHEPVAHWHLHFGPRGSHPVAVSHSHLPTIIGAAFAVSSVRALTLLAPLGGRLDGTPLPVLLGLIAVFAAGILLSMSLFGIALARFVTARIAATGRVIIAMGAIALGGYWIAGGR